MDETQAKLRNDPDFILIKRFNNSLAKLLDRYPEGAPDRIIAQALGITEEEVVAMYDKIVVKLRGMM